MRQRVLRLAAPAPALPSVSLVQPSRFGRVAIAILEAADEQLIGL